jgi:hypothetical protein
LLGVARAGTSRNFLGAVVNDGIFRIASRFVRARIPIGVIAFRRFFQVLFFRVGLPHRKNNTPILTLDFLRLFFFGNPQKS